MVRKHILVALMGLAVSSLAGCGESGASASSDLGASSFESDSSEPASSVGSTHEHTFDTSAWEYDAEYHWHPSTCGHDVTTTPVAHAFSKQVTEPTYSNGGYSTYTCDVCGYSYKGDETSRLEHAYTLIFDLNGGTSNSYVASKGVESLSATDFFFDCKKSGYNFRGWSYNGAKVFDEFGNTVFSPTMEKQMTFVAIFANDARMSIKANIDEAGSVSGSGYYEYNSDVDVLATPHQGYEFVGWYDSDGLPISSSASYKYRMADKDIEIEARFKLASFSLSIHSNDSSLGIVFINPTASTPLSDYSENASETIAYTHDVKVIASTKSDVRFLGWYDEDSNLVSNSAVYSFSMPNHDYSLEAKWNRFSVTYETNGGTNSSLNPSYVSTDDQVALSSPTREGYDFKGWEDKKTGTIVKNIAAGTLDDVELVAKWEPHKYAIHYELGNNGVNPTDNPGFYTIEQSVTLDDPSRPGYGFAGWYSDSSYSSPCSSIALGSTGEKTFYAKWVTVSYSITYELAGGVNNSANPDSFTTEKTIRLASPSKVGYEFDGWYLDASYRTKIEVVSSGTIGNITLYAKWKAAKHELSITSADSKKGSVSIISGEGHSDEAITISATPSDGYALKGWYSGANLVSRDNPYTFVMPTSDYSLKAVFYTKSEEEERLGIRPVVDAAGETLTYGLYPQSHVSDATIVSSLNALTSCNSNGWYLFNGEYYAKIASAAPYKTGCTFDDGERIYSGEEYWFKCEPIKWRILSSSNGEYSLVSSALLDICKYNSPSNNNYLDSAIREWLNGSFYDSAFGLSDSLIETTRVDNSASTTANDDNEYACSNTEDKVYLLSYQDYTNTNYGFSDDRVTNDALRKCSPTDWAKAKGNWFYTYIEKGVGTECGWYWTRSPAYFSSEAVWYVYNDGALYTTYTVQAQTAVRPGLHIKIS